MKQDDTSGAAASSISIQPLDTQPSMRTQAYHALRDAITSINIYAQDEDIRLDERTLSRDLGVSRTPIREAMTMLEREGFVRTVPRRGIFVVRKSKREIIEMIQVWAALEALAARLATAHASDRDIAGLRHLFDEFQEHSPQGHIDEYSDANIKFHQAIIHLSGNQVLADMTETLFIHVRAIRHLTIGQGDRAARSIVDHMNIIKALQARNPEQASKLCLEHTLGLAAHVEKNCAF